MSTSIIYLQSGASTLTVFSDGSSYFNPPANPCWLPEHKLIGTAQNGLTLDFKTG
jgi:hypothetical protein